MKKLFVRCAIFPIAALVLAGCKTSEEPSKLGMRISKTSPVMAMTHSSQSTAWKGGHMEGFGGFGDGEEPETPNWIRHRQEKAAGKPCGACAFTCTRSCQASPSHAHSFHSRDGQKTGADWRNAFFIIGYGRQTASGQDRLPSQ